MPVGPFPAGGGTMAGVLSAALGAGVGVGWEWARCQQPLSPALCAQRRNCERPCGMTGLIPKQRQSPSP